MTVTRQVAHGTARMARPKVVLLEPLYHPAGESLLRAHCEVEVLRAPSAAAAIAAAADADAL